VGKDKNGRGRRRYYIGCERGGMTMKEYVPWQWLILGILDERSSQIELQDIYIEIEKRNDELKKVGSELINQDLFEIYPGYGNRPKYQHSVRSHLSSYRKKGWVSKIDRAIYLLTDEGKKRLKWVKENA
jgi:hypothetical protein